MMPKLSFGSWAFAFGPFAAAPWPFAQTLRFIADAGYDGVEINGFRPHPHPDDFRDARTRSALKEQIRGFGLGISGYGPDFHDVPPGQVDGEAYLRVLRRSLEFCNGLDIPVLRLDTVAPPQALPPAEYEQRFSRLVRTWRVAAEECQRAGVLLVWEFEPGFWLNRPSEVRRLVDAVGHANFKTLFDTSHAYMGAVVGARHCGAVERLPGGVVEYAKLLDGQIGHIHLIDSDGSLHDNETSTHTAFGQGHVDFTAVLATLMPVLRRLEWCCVDFCFNPAAEAEGRNAVGWVRTLFRKLEEQS